IAANAVLRDVGVAAVRDVSVATRRINRDGARAPPRCYIADPLQPPGGGIDDIARHAVVTRVRHESETGTGRSATASAPTASATACGDDERRKDKNPQDDRNCLHGLLRSYSECSLSTRRPRSEIGQAA